MGFPIKNTSVFVVAAQGDDSNVSSMASAAIDGSVNCESLKEIDLEPLGRGHVGEIVVMGTAVAGGYLGDPESTTSLPKRDRESNWIAAAVARTNFRDK